ncbi:very-long-chain 3-oxoacyl-CoA reductase-B-like [Brevipalpus obovatus]|uniref:very-long-chain 3-oxoacyl-CoA reductase-B-like n=1 Tax=Brevipalpus obovatus TaxID=246614 RepID=UPI003D9DBD06
MIMIEFYQYFGYFISVFFLFFVPFYFLTQSVCKYFPYLFNNKVNLKAKPGSWAVITGCTSGIGLEFARELGRRGYNLWLISRTEDNLSRVASSIRTKYPQCERIITTPFDFNSTDYRTLDQVIQEIPSITILVNNIGTVGTDDSLPEYFIVQPKEILTKIINVNIFSCVHLTYLVLEKMKPQTGIIINVSAIFATHGAPLWAAGGSSKGFIDTFARCLDKECSEKDIRVCSLLTAGVQTRRVPFKENLTIPSASSYVKSVLKTVQYNKQYTGFWTHELFLVMLKWMPIFSLWSNSEDYFSTKMYAKVRHELYAKHKRPVTYGGPQDFPNDLMSIMIQSFGVVKVE